MQLKSIQAKITLWAGICLVVTTFGIVIYSALSVRKTAINFAKNQATVLARGKATQIKAEMDKALDAARTISQVFAQIQDEEHPVNIGRKEAMQILREIITHNQRFAGVFTCWEPDAFDGMDDDFVSTEGHDKTGRFIPYWSRHKNSEITLETSLDYEKPGAGDYYRLARKTRRECIVGPRIRNNQMLISLTVPIIANDKFYGIVGINLEPAFFQEQLESTNLPEESGKIVLLNHAGIQVGVSGESDTGGETRPIQDESAACLSVIRTGKEKLFWESSELKIFTPVKAGYTTTPWSVNIILPSKVITSRASGLIWRLIILGTVLTIAALGIIWFLAKRIADPIKKLKNVALRIAEGNLNQEIHIKSQDETGELAQAFCDMEKALIVKVDTAEQIAHGNLEFDVKVVSQADILGQAMIRMKASIMAVTNDVYLLAEKAVAGELNSNVESTKHGGQFQRIIQGINETLIAIIKPINEATVVMEKMADQDLRPRITGDYPGDHAKIKSALNKALENLDRTLHQISTGADQVNMAADQISQSSQMLAQGASEQASSLEEVSSNLQEMASMTKQNAKNAQTAQGISEDASKSASNGMNSMKRLSLVIEKIKGSADETAKIVKTIDDIAFQTNLLALNAAVEAARAGEAGKGFAVVAEEVRNLAMRSAEAAKDTAKLIEESVKNAENGVVVNQEVVMNLEEINEQVNKVNEVMCEISTASTHQTQGIDQINTAIDQMNQLTQANAASSEESASAAQELSSQAKEMNRLIAGFQLSGKIQDTAFDSSFTLKANVQANSDQDFYKDENGIKNIKVVDSPKSPQELIPFDDETDMDTLMNF